MIFIGIDDTDMPDTPGTNQLAKALALHLAGQYHCALVVRHQLWQDRCIPSTSKNSAASLHLVPRDVWTMHSLIDRSRDFLRSRFVDGSDPGLCVATAVPEAVTAFGSRCQRGLASQGEARRLAERHGLWLEGLGGTEDGVIGALAAVGLAAAADDGRVVQIGSHRDDLSGPQDVETLRARHVEVRCCRTGRPVRSGTVDVGRHLRPNLRQKRFVLFARPALVVLGGSSCWHAVRRT